ncbi:MAG TPA: MarR family transcriptional regulator [Herpetosiphonaceae bacterium]|nr:MarR family transcriptional regulator [Herpetosiphonaceae bacterium]
MNEIFEQLPLLSAAYPLLALLWQTGRITAERLDVSLASVGMSFAKLVALVQLVKAGEPLPLSQLATQMSCARSNVTQLVDRLEADGLAERVRDTSDRRAVMAVITDEGRRRYEASFTIMSGIEDALLGRLTQDERQQLTRLLAKVCSDSV